MVPPETEGKVSGRLIITAHFITAAFTALDEVLPDKIVEVEELINILEDNYIGRFITHKLLLHAVTQSLRSNNSVEGWHAI